MSSFFCSVYKQARQTFDVRNSSSLKKNLSALKSLVDQIRYSDLGLPAEIISKPFFTQTPDKAPCTYVQIYEDDEVSMSVFILAENYCLPLHDHPQMHGLLKCVAGSLRIQSYSLLDEEPLQALDRLYDITCPMKQKRLLCQVEPVSEISIQSEAAVLHSRLNNFHQITAIGGPVAFFDILSPPYDSVIKERPMLHRKCTFFRTVPISYDSHRIILEKIAPPLNYYCDNVEYNRPKFITDQSTHLDQ